jgi:hypothetical protein
MSKKITLLLSGILLGLTSYAQTTIFHEDFEPADSVTATGTPLWQQDLTLFSQGTASYKNQVSASGQSELTTIAFNTTGNAFVLLNFDHICKLEFMDSAVVEVSNDNGTTWTRLTYNEYLGAAPQFRTSCGGRVKRLIFLLLQEMQPR